MNAAKVDLRYGTSIVEAARNGLTHGRSFVEMEEVCDEHQ
jgi:hypothetical protein